MIIRWCIRAMSPWPPCSLLVVGVVTRGFVRHPLENCARRVRGITGQYRYNCLIPIYRREIRNRIEQTLMLLNYSRNPEDGKGDPRKLPPVGRTKNHPMGHKDHPIKTTDHFGLLSIAHPPYLCIFLLLHLIQR